MEGKQEVPEDQNVTTTNENNPDASSSFKPTFENGQLSYLGFDIETLPAKLVEDYCNITSRLDLSFNQLKNLSGLEHFKFLKELVLDNNELDDTVVFPCLKDLHTLTINKNKIRDLYKLVDQLVSCFPNLTYLSLLGNEACPNQLSSNEKDEEDYQRYRYYVVYKIPGLKFLDSSQVTASEVQEAKRVGPYQQIVRPKDNLEDSDSLNSGSPTVPYSPLPSESQKENIDHQGTFGKTKYIYYGRHSEGNRFIRNKDL
ncbi:leucine-rich melanocyte differentiation-associated protein-like isoform X2 [Physella acuta]|uniref:leucine-rich melanocyte differentiation-associated protein-like isoform X2 n=1 Tax=Physella acuta TaxID=109671 RepID=UPI0027DDAAA7|nr:leucine-rich melanocyte differentiation-associated protein-like isoform X2 [Physella acuta]